MSLLIKGGVTNFISLADTPESYAAQSQRIARVKATLDGIEFAEAITQYNLPTNFIPDNLGEAAALATCCVGSARIRVAGKYVIAAEGDYITIVDVSDPDSPVLRDRHAEGGEGSVLDVFVAGKYIYAFSELSNNLLIYDWLTDASINLISGVNVGADFGSGIWVRGKYAYVTGANRITVVDVSTPTNPKVIGSLVDATYLVGASDVVVLANYAYVIGMPYLTVVNITDPTNPTRVASLAGVTTVGAGLLRMQIVGKYAYIADRNGSRLRIVDISDPTDMTIEGTFTDATYLYNVNDVAVIGDWVFMGNNSGATWWLTVIDARDKAAMIRHESFEVGTPTGALALAGKYAFLGAGAGATKRFSVIQVWSLDLPALLGNVIWCDQLYAYRAQVFEQIETQQILANGIGIPDALPKTASYCLLASQVLATDPDTSYVELSALYRTNIDFSKLAVKRARVIVSAIGSEAGAAKGIEIYNSTDAAAICEVVWDEAAQQNGLAGAWTNCNLRAAIDLQVRVKASNATEDITVDRVELQLEYSY